jgi:hypothetical protein
MRVAYYGLSSPIFYDYKVQADKTQNDTWDSPNPVLDSGFGTILLFDEIWFFCESLCPQNMRKLPYVKFVDTLLDGKIFENINVDKIWKDYGGEEGTANREFRLHENFKIYRDVVSQIGVNWDAAPDSHTHSIKVGQKTYSGNSMRPDNIFFDLATVELLKKKFKKKDIELVTNSFTQTWLDSPESVLAKSKLTELLIIENFPGYLTQLGPYHNCIEEVRENSYLKSYRVWISGKQLKPDLKELADVKKEIENVIEQAKKQQFLKYLDPESTFESITKTVLGAIADEMIPYVSTAKGLIEEFSERKEKKKIMWQGFIITAKDQVN